jgi:hypothetical protein
MASTHGHPSHRNGNERQPLEANRQAILLEAVALKEISAFSVSSPSLAELILRAPTDDPAPVTAEVASSSLVVPAFPDSLPKTDNSPS